MLPYSTLGLADDSDWETESGYDPVVAMQLKFAYGFIERVGDLKASYLKAAETLRPLLAEELACAAHQREHIFYLCAMGFAANVDYEPALFCIDQALEEALALEERDDICELLYLRSANHRAISRFREASEDVDECLELLPEAPSPVDALAYIAFRVTLLAQQTGYLFYTMQYERAQHVIAKARQLIPLVPHLRFEAATIEWAQAHLRRTQGETVPALLLALSVCHVYEREANPISQGRIHGFVADVTLDWVERLIEISRDSTKRGDVATMLTLARAHLQEAERLARQTHDTAGKCLAQLIRARYARLSGSTRDRLAMIEAVLKAARRLDDEIVLAQCFTVLGDELMAQGKIKEALDTYRNVLGVLDGSEAPAQAIRARRVLLRASEMQVDDLPVNELRVDEPGADEPQE